MPIRACVFDAYGTLFDVSAAARIAAGEPGREALAAVWPKLAADWRGKQLQYTWLRSLMGVHADFWQVTQDGLDWAMEAAGLADDGLRARLLALYRELAAYPEVPGMLAALKAGGAAGRRSCRTGRPRCWRRRWPRPGSGRRSMRSCRSRRWACSSRMRGSTTLWGGIWAWRADEVLFVSSNGWDAAGAAHYGFRTVWVNRAGEPVDRLPARPGHVMADLTGIPALAEGF